MCNSSAGSEEEAGGNSRQRHNRHGRDGAPGSLEKRMEELEKVCFQRKARVQLPLVSDSERSEPPQPDVRGHVVTASLTTFTCPTEERRD